MIASALNSAALREMMAAMPVVIFYKAVRAALARSQAEQGLQPSQAR